MNSNFVIDALQLLSAALWASVMFVRFPCVVRAVRDREPSLADFYASLLVANGAVQLGFVLRWSLYPGAKIGMEPGELTLWGCLYFVSALIALSSHRLPRHG